METETGQLEEITEQIKSSLPNLEEDKRFEGYNKPGFSAAGLVARDIVEESKSPDDFLRVEIDHTNYRDRPGDVIQIVYAIGWVRETRESNDLLYLERWNHDVNKRKASVKHQSFLKLNSFRIVDE